MHFENTTTCRAESAHAKLKTNTGNLETCWEKMHDLLETLLNAIKASFEKSVNIVQPRYKSPVFQFLRGVVSIAALDKVLEEMKSVGEYGVDSLVCGCVMRTKCGFPYTHEIDEHIHSSEPICVDTVDRFWRKLDMKPLEGVERFREIVNPSTTSSVELEVQYKTRGAFVFDVHQSSNAMFSTKQTQKQKVMRHKRTEDIPTTLCIDQMPCVYQPFVEKIEDVNRWPLRVSCNCWKNSEEWKRCFIEIGRWEVIEEAVHCFEEFAEPNHWFILPDMGHVIASIYNVILVTLGGCYPATFLSLFSAPPATPRIITMALVKYGESKSLNHFVRVCLTLGYPFTTITLQWRNNRSDCANGWENLITTFDEKTI
ncbi:hypothetical protein C2S53_011663 [Perilla frutescens var. hirtella]|uniref:Protein FAR1-RELATED SEQUENCE n=1 Tax=Perilla frutescens var. hirtella TaxID=608512 RepID=A0AAD4J8N9_PERFH|nr:hypothetical protein C2S53_011663 [Perilla frutescens var. hirtella]